MLELLAPYFLAGMSNKESCIWVVPDTVSRDEAVNSIEGAAKRRGIRPGAGPVEVVSFNDWYLQDRLFHPGRVLEAWRARLTAALSRGHRCLRITGDTSWVRQEDWNMFMMYEAEINRKFAADPLVAVCTFAMHRTPQPRMRQVLATHQLGVIKRCGTWALLPTTPG